MLINFQKGEEYTFQIFCWHWRTNLIKHCCILVHICLLAYAFYLTLLEFFQSSTLPWQKHKALWWFKELFVLGDVVTFLSLPSFALLLSLPAASMMAGRVVTESCPLGQFPCGNMSVCLPQVLQCNGHRDCINGADEEHCGEAKFTVSVFFLLCW